MTFHSTATQFAGRPVVEVPIGDPLPAVDGPVAWRFSFWEYDDRAPVEQNTVSPGFLSAFEAFVDAAGASVESLVIGAWGYAAFNPAPIEQLCALAPRLPALRSLFLGDMTSEDCEVSWMLVGDVSPLLAAFPGLEVLTVRGGQDFRFSPVRHPVLRQLSVQSGGLPREFVAAVLASDLPALTDLELWLGTSDYGGTTTVADLAPLLAGERFPALHGLGLRNAEIVDDLAGALAQAPVVARLRRLDLSLGELSDTGAAALINGQPLGHLTELDLHHHFLSEQLAQAVVTALPGVRVDVGDRQEPEQYGGESYRYTAVSE